MNGMYTSGEYLQNTQTWHVEDSAWKARQILRGMREHHLAPETVCEVGCGAGEILNQLYEALPPHTRFTGFEISPQAFALCREREKERLVFRNEDILATPETYDLLLAVDVFEHVPDYLGFLTALREKAMFKIFHIPLELTVRSLFFGDALPASRRTMGHLHYFDRSTALAALEDCGYAVLGDFYTFWQGELPHRVPKSFLDRLAMRCLKAWNEDLAVRVLGGHSLLVVAR
ncbi:MAG TPA: methyltransferase domain-containing protein [Geobacteraceae bacterium]|nr:methyltransferase domain-containing protein [Geobacteraceae bacterium]